MTIPLIFGNHYNIICFWSCCLKNILAMSDVFYLKDICLETKEFAKDQCKTWMNLYLKLKVNRLFKYFSTDMFLYVFEILETIWLGSNIIYLWLIHDQLRIHGPKKPSRAKRDRHFWKRIIVIKIVIWMQLIFLILIVS